MIAYGLFFVSMALSAFSLYAAHRAARCAGMTFWGLFK